MTVKSHKKLIEVSIPLLAINEEAARRKRKAPMGYPTALHKWWAQRPVAAARAVLFAQMVDDPSSNPDLFPTEKKQEKERQRLFKIIEDLVQWENTDNEKVIQAAREEIWQSWRRACAENADAPGSRELFDRKKLPGFHDPFAGGGTLPLEAQRLGLESNATDLNPVAVLINKAMIEIPPKFANRPPVNPDVQKDRLDIKIWKGAQGLAEDVRYYAESMREEAQKRIGDLYPAVEITHELAHGRSDLKLYIGKKLPVVAWLWVRTVKSPNPAFAKIDVPLCSTYMLSNLDGREAYVEPIIENGGYRFTVRVGKPKNAKTVSVGTKLERANFACLLSGVPISGEYIKAESKAGRMGTRMMAIVAKGDRGRVYLPPIPEQEAAARKAKPLWQPEVSISGTTQYVGVKSYGMEQYSELFTPRQLVALTTFCDLIEETRGKICEAATAAGLHDDQKRFAADGQGAAAYADAVAVYLAFVMSRVLHHNSTLCTWLIKDAAIRQTFSKQAFQMTWDFVEGSVFGSSSAEWGQCYKTVANAIEKLPCSARGDARTADAAVGAGGNAGTVVSTDPPYYDNVPYADLSDYFYVWLRYALKSVFPELFATVAVPKTEELVAFAYRHHGKEGAEAFFLEGMTRAMHHLAEESHPAFPVTIYYAFKQSEHDDKEGTASTGWDTFLAAVIAAGFGVTGTWPLRTEGDNRQRGIGSNALASSIVLVCRPRAANAPLSTRREFVATLKAELPAALIHLQRANIAPVDLAQAAIGPGMAVFTRYNKVLDAQGNAMTVRDSLALINEVLDEALAQQEGDFDADSRWALAWFEQYGFEEGDYGVAETLSKAKNTSVVGLVDAGILQSKRGKVRLLQPKELPQTWSPETDNRLTNWETVHHLIRVLESGGESGAAGLVSKLGSKAEAARELAYRLYALCERKKRANEALAYNGLVQSWPELVRLARDGEKAKAPPAVEQELGV
jgi:putative DNA methylase